MSTKTDIPVTITPEAAAFVAELGLQQEFEQMIEQARQTIPGVVSIRADYYSGYGVDTPGIDIEATVSDFKAAREGRGVWGVWRLTAFPPQVGQYFVLNLAEDSTNAG